MAGLDAIRKQLEQKAQRAAAGTTRGLERDLKQRAPVETGQLQDSITAKSEPTTTGFEVKVEVDSPYSWRMRDEFEAVMRMAPDTLARAWRGVR